MELMEIYLAVLLIAIILLTSSVLHDIHDVSHKSKKKPEMNILGPTWEECKKAIEEADDVPPEEISGWDEATKQLFIGDIKMMKKIAESDDQAYSFARCEGYSLWKVKMCDRWVLVKFIKQGEKIMAINCGYVYVGL